MRVQITRKAQTHLREIYTYYKEIDKGLYGRKIRQKIIDKALKLKTFPNQGQIQEGIKSQYEYRYLISGNYKAIYRVIEKIIYIVGVYDTRQNPDNMEIE